MYCIEENKKKCLFFELLNENQKTGFMEYAEAIDYKIRKQSQENYLQNDVYNLCQQFVMGRCEVCKVNAYMDNDIVQNMCFCNKGYYQDRQECVNCDIKDEQNQDYINKCTICEIYNQDQNDGCQCNNNQVKIREDISETLKYMCQTCQNIIEFCETCKISKGDSQYQGQIICTMCQGDSRMKYDFEKNKCLCEYGYYFNTDNNMKKCFKCNLSIVNCQECQKSYQCIKCNQNYKLSEDRTSCICDKLDINGNLDCQGSIKISNSNGEVMDNNQENENYSNDDYYSDNNNNNLQNSNQSMQNNSTDFQNQKEQIDNDNNKNQSGNNYQINLSEQNYNNLKLILLIIVLVLLSVIVFLLLFLYKRKKITEQQFKQMVEEKENKDYEQSTNQISQITQN